MLVFHRYLHQDSGQAAETGTNRPVWSLSSNHAGAGSQ